MKIGFGLDLGGLSKEGTALAVIEVAGLVANAYILRNSPLTKKIRGNADLIQRITDERRALISLLDHGPLAVDVPIDLQDLGSPNLHSRVWELTLRPVDKAFSALPPLASFLGACVARFRASIDGISSEQDLKHPLFETYPAASLEKIGLPNKKYKKEEESSKLRARIQEGLGIKGGVLPHDDLDAIICALAAIAEGEDVLANNALRDEMLERLGSEASPNRHKVPINYRILRRPPCFATVNVIRCDFKEWLQRH